MFFKVSVIYLVRTRNNSTYYNGFGGCKLGACRMSFDRFPINDIFLKNESTV